MALASGGPDYWERERPARNEREARNEQLFQASSAPGGAVAGGSSTPAGLPRWGPRTPALPV